MHHALVLAACIAITPAVAQNVWTQIQPGVVPSPRWGHAMAYDPVNNVTVMFGGYNNAAGVYLNDTWLFNGTTWQQVAVTGPKPSPRMNAAMCYDSARGRIVLLGGMGFNDCWFWNGTTWALAGNFGVPSGEYTMAFDSIRNVIVAFNGHQTIEGDGVAFWTPRPSPSTTLGHCGAMTFDVTAGKSLLFINGQTWHWNGTTWTQLSPAVSPPFRRLHRMVYEAHTGRSVVFGGTDSGEFNDTWSWNGSTWAQLISAGPPPARHSHGMAYHASLQRVVLFGGTYGLDDTWLKNTTSSAPATVTAFGTGCAGSAGMPQMAPALGSLPWIGSSFQINLTNLPPFPFWAPFGVVGYSNTTWGANSLPLDLTPVGMTGCHAHVSVDHIVTLANSGGASQWMIPVPASVPLVGARLYLQGSLVEPTANPFGMVVSNALAIVVGAL